MATVISRKKRTTRPRKAASIPEAARPVGRDHGVFGFGAHSTLIDHFDLHAARIIPATSSSIDGEVHILGSNVDDAKKLEQLQAQVFGQDISHWQKGLIANRNHEVLFMQTARGPVWLVRPRFHLNGKKRRYSGAGVSSPYATMRDRVGGLWPALRDTPGVKHLGVFLHGCTNEESMGALLGFELASYRFTHVVRGQASKPSFKCSMFGATEAHRRAALAMGRSMNLARHLVNTDAAKLNPASYSQAVTRWFKGKRGVRVDVWGPERLRREGMHLHAGVGQAAEQGSHMVHIQYRPNGKARFKAPLAIVGKGVTFDTGGLDIKPASGMRLMKKDMGGSASVVGLANWLSESGSDVACDLYLALAENAVSGNAFHPGDVITARNGVSVEIHNTDAEGRLVMADVFDVALTQKEKPCALIDLATLTGAMRVAVGVEIAGFFANHDGLAAELQKHGELTGDPCWRLPLWDSYRGQLKSSFADMANASDSGFAGAITAALFFAAICT